MRASVPLVKWLPDALGDLARLREFIRVHDPRAADRAAKQILDGVRKLQKHPLLGRPAIEIDRPQLRDFFIPFGQAGYWLRYSLTDELIIIVRIWHGLENRTPP